MPSLMVGQVCWPKMSCFFLFFLQVGLAPITVGPVKEEGEQEEEEVMRVAKGAARPSSCWVCLSSLFFFFFFLREEL